MPATRPSTTLFEDAIDVPMWLDGDRATPFLDRSNRDRAIGSKLHVDDTVARARSWWQLVDRKQPAATGAQLQRTRGLVSVGMFVAGALAGTGVALTAFHYDGSRPINVVTLLATLVLAPSVLLLLTLLLIPARVPGLRALQDLLAMINPGALAASIYRRLAKPPRDAAQLFGWHPGRSAAAGRFAKWQLLVWSQTAAVAFFLAAIATAAVLITFTDLAFGWSTTLAADPRAIDRIVRALALPWHSWLPSAVPDPPLIERSQFFRLDAGRALDIGASRALTGWWSFAIVTIAIYGALPRVALLAFCAARLRAATRGLLLEDPRVTALLDRMSAPAIETAASEPEQHRASIAPSHAAPLVPLVGTARAVIWSASIERALADAHSRKAFGMGLNMVVEAGGDRTLGEDRAAIEAVSGGAVATVVVFTRAWEPPLLEFLDFIAALRRALGAAASIVVAPVADATAGVDLVQRETWARAITRLADPHLYLEIGAA